MVTKSKLGNGTVIYIPKDGKSFYPEIHRPSDVTKYFDKSEFSIDDEIDKSLKNFIIAINHNENIMTKYCCEGHEENEWDGGYLFFNVNMKGFNIFWSKCVPDIVLRCGTVLGVLPSVFTIATFEISNKTNPGLTIRCNSHQFKDIFWDVVKKTMLTHFPPHGEIHKSRGRQVPIKQA